MGERSSLLQSMDPSAEPLAHTAPAVGGGRLGVYAAFGAAAGALALPWLPDWLSSHVRGALVHDVAVRHCVSLTPEARAVLAQPLAPGVHRGVAARAARFLGARLAARAMRGFGPIGLIWPLGGALRTYVLGHLFDRYLEHRSERAVRVDEREATRVRRAIEAAQTRAFTLDPEPPREPASIDDHRDPATAMIDRLLGRAAGIPERLGRRLDAAFDEALRFEGAIAQGPPE
ncbi:MAG TPA: hypothetical protein VEK07_14860 [Polyangiaceae bacterium]|nr:hypothetical protein [Polyangiaceae bacterium]